MSYCPHQRLSNSCHSLIMVLSQMCYFRNDNMFSSLPADLRMPPTCISKLTHQADMPFHIAQRKTGSLGSPPKHVPLSDTWSCCMSCHSPPGACHCHHSKETHHPSTTRERQPCWGCPCRNSRADPSAFIVCLPMHNRGHATALPRLIFGSVNVTSAGHCVM